MDFTSLTHGGDACNVTEFESDGADHDHGSEHSASTSGLVIGVVLSVVADAIIAISLNVQKVAHNRNQGSDGKPVKAFVKLPLWWVGILLNAGGEVGNMLAYGFAPASVVAPVGSVGVVVNEIIAVTFLKEPFRRRDILGLCGVICGVCLIIFGVPETEGDLSVHLLLSDEVWLNPRAYWYVLALILMLKALIVWFEPRYAQRQILVWLGLCSTISSMTVLACRGFSSLITLVPEDCAGSSCAHGVVHVPCATTIGHWFFWVSLLVIVVTAVWSAYYLNRAMQVFGNTEVVPVYYCTFTLMSIIGGAFVYNEFQHVTLAGGFMFGGGILLALFGVWLITSNRATSQHFQGLADVDEKVDALAEQSDSSARLSFGHIGASLVQLKVDYDAAADRDRAREKMMAAHYPASFEAATRVTAVRLAATVQDVIHRQNSGAINLAATLPAPRPRPMGMDQVRVAPQEV